MNYDAISFDAGHTLLEQVRPTQVGWADALSGMGAFSPERLSATFEEAVADRQLAPGGAESLEDHQAEWSNVYAAALEAVGFTGDLDRAVDIMWDVWLYRTWAPYPEVPGVLDELRKRGLKLAVVSNWVPTLELTLDRLGLGQYFNVVACSAVLGCAKPEPGIFHHAVDTLDVPRDKVLHIGDSYTSDVLGARSAGLNAALLQRGSDAPPDDATSTLRSLDALFTLL